MSDDITIRFPHLFRKLPPVLGVSKTRLHQLRKIHLKKGEHWIIHQKKSLVSDLGLLLLREAMEDTPVEKTPEEPSSAHPAPELPPSEKTAEPDVMTVKILGSYINPRILRGLHPDGTIYDIQLRHNQAHLSQRLKGKRIRIRQMDGSRRYELYGRALAI